MPLEVGNNSGSTLISVRPTCAPIATIPGAPSAGNVTRHTNTPQWHTPPGLNPADVTEQPRRARSRCGTPLTSGSRAGPTLKSDVRTAFVLLGWGAVAVAAKGVRGASGGLMMVCSSSECWLRQRFGV